MGGRVEPVRRNSYFIRVEARRDDSCQAPLVVKTPRNSERGTRGSPQIAHDRCEGHHEYFPLGHPGSDTFNSVNLSINIYAARSIPAGCAPILAILSPI